MASSIAGASVELTGEATKAAIRGSGHLARKLGGNVVQRLQPNSIPQEVLERFSPDILEVLKQQAFLKQHVGRVAMVGDLIDPDNSLEDEAGLKARASSRAQTLVEVGVARPDTVAELRLVAPKDAIDDPVVDDHFERAAWFTRHALAHDHGITSMPFDDPITPTERRDAPIDLAARRATWGGITDGLVLLSEQLDDDESQRRPAMVAFMGAPYSNVTLEDQAGESRLLEHYKVLLLRGVGTLPEDNSLVPASRIGISESPDSPSPSIWQL
jgi:hypothetical protein